MGTLTFIFQDKDPDRQTLIFSDVPKHRLAEHQTDVIKGREMTVIEGETTDPKSVTFISKKRVGLIESITWTADETPPTAEEIAWARKIMADTGHTINDDDENEV